MVYTSPMAALNRVDIALRKVDDFFMGKSPVHDTLLDLVRRLGEAEIDYALIGGLALNLHGYERVTADVDLLMTREGLEKFRETFVGLGYVPAHSGARKHFKNTETGIRVEIITAGEYPGDGQPKDVSFPVPSQIAEDIDGIKVISLVPLIELKLASGLSAAHRIKDIADVQQIIEQLDLPLELGERLNPSVRDEYVRLWQVTASAKNIGPDKD